jgi:hypothetical protein
MVAQAPNATSELSRQMDVNDFPFPRGGIGNLPYRLLVVHTNCKLPNDPRLAESRTSMSFNGRDLFRNQFYRHCPILVETARIKEILASVAKIDMWMYGRCREIGQ